MKNTFHSQDDIINALRTLASAYHKYEAWLIEHYQEKRQELKEVIIRKSVQ